MVRRVPETSKLLSNWSTIYLKTEMFCSLGYKMKCNKIRYYAFKLFLFLP